MRTLATLKLNLADVPTRSSLISVLSPDNKELPKGLGLSVRTAGEAAEFTIESSSPSTTLSTVLALLRDAGLFQEVWLLSQRNNGGDRGPDSN